MKQKIYFSLLQMAIGFTAFAQSPVLSNVSCNPGANINIASDDFIQFNLQPTPPVNYYVAPFTYSVTATQNGSPVTVTMQDGSPASNVHYFNNYASAFRLANGTSGNGNVVISVTPDFGSYPASTVTLSDPGSCNAAVSCGNGKTITYSYQSPRGGSDASDWQSYIPKFENTGGKILTGVTVNVQGGVYGGLYVENGSTGATTFRAMSGSSYWFQLNANTLAFLTDTAVITSGYPSLMSLAPNQVFSGSTGAYPGDSLATGGVYRTITRLNTMGQFITNSMYLGLDSKLHPNWITTLTGISTSADDIYINVGEGSKNQNFTYNNSNSEFTNFIGSGNIPLTFTTFSSLNVAGGGGLMLTGQATSIDFKVTVTYTYDKACFMISGNVYNDGNGNTNGLVNHVTNTGGTGINNPEGQQLYANLLNASGNVIAITPIATNGSYSFNNVAGDATYTVQVSTVQGLVGNPAPSPSLPSNWFNTGEQLGTVANVNLDNNTGGNLIDGKKTISVTNADVINVNFGINKTPNADMKSYTFSSTPVGGTTVPLNGTNNTYGATPGLLSGNDREDGAQGGVTSKFVITSLPTNGVLKYWNGTTEVSITAADVTNGTVFTNPANLRFSFVGSGYNTTTFVYAFVDNAGMKGSTNTYTINMTTPVPVELLNFVATSKNCETILDWTIGDAINFDRFEVETSIDGKSYQQLTVIAANGKTYQFKTEQSDKEVYYRLRMVDFDGQFKNSNALKIVSDCGATAITVYPNPANNQINVKGAALGTTINVFNIVGQKVLSRIADGQDIQTLNVANLANGVYTIEVLDDASKNVFKFNKND